MVVLDGTVVHLRIVGESATISGSMAATTSESDDGDRYDERDGSAALSGGANVSTNAAASIITVWGQPFTMG